MPQGSCNYISLGVLYLTAIHLVTRPKHGVTNDSFYRQLAVYVCVPCVVDVDLVRPFHDLQ